MTILVEATSIEDAARALEDVSLRTPLVEAPWIARATARLDDPATAENAPAGNAPAANAPTGNPPEIRLKCENLQRGGAFKLRGAYTMISRLDAPSRERGVITYSSGNHGQAVAIAAGLFGVPAVVVMPETAPQIKVDRTRKAGAEVVFEGTTSVERHRRAEAIAAERGLTIIPPFDHPDIIAGQGTVGREILEEWPEVEAVLVPVGGGGLVSGVAAWIKRAKPAFQVIAVEPVGADALRRSIRAGEPVTLDRVDTVADGLAPVRPGELNFLHVRELVDDFVAVTDEAILDAVERLHTESDLIVENSGAAAVAALLSGAWKPNGRRTVTVLSGGNRHVDQVR